MFKKSKLEKALAKGLRPGGALHSEIYKLGRYRITTVRDAKAIRSALVQYQSNDALRKGRKSIFSALHSLAGLFQDAGSERAYRVLRDDGLPQLLSVFDQEFSQPDADQDTLL